MWYYSSLVNGNFTEWTAWSECTAGCGVDVNRTRTRSCTNPAPQFSGSACMADGVYYATNQTEYQSCNLSCCVRK